MAAVLVALGACGSAAAQVISAPARSTVPNAGAEPQQTLTITASTTGGWDENQTGLLGAVGGDVGLSGYTAFADAGLAYTRTQGARESGVTARGYVSSFPGSNVQTGFGGDFSGRSAVGFGRTRLDLIGRARYEPFFSLGAFAPTQGEAVAPADSTPLAGLSVDQHAWSYDAGSTLSRTWSAMTNTSAGYSYLRRDFSGASNLGSDTEMHSLQVAHTVGLDRTTGLGWTYQLTESSFNAPTSSIQTGDMTTHAVEMTFNIQRRLTRTRRLALQVGGGAQHAAGQVNATAPYAYWTPTALATLRVDLGRSWALNADYRRATAALASFTQRPFAGDTVQLRTGGNLARRVNAAVTLAYSGGESAAVGERGRFSNTIAAAQLGFDVARWCSAVIGYTHFQYSLAELVGVPSALPRDFSRSALRGGVTIVLPVIDAQRGSRDRGRPRRGTPAQPTPDDGRREPGRR